MEKKKDFIRQVKILTARCKVVVKMSFAIQQQHRRQAGELLRSYRTVEVKLDKLASEIWRS